MHFATQAIKLKIWKFVEEKTWPDFAFGFKGNTFLEIHFLTEHLHRSKFNTIQGKNGLNHY